MSEALESRITVFVSSPYRADTPEEISGNVEKAKRYCRLVYERGYAPFAPHLHNPQFMVDSDKWMECGQAMLLRCDEMLVFYEDGITSGMKEEILFAYRNGIPINFTKVDANGGSIEFNLDECSKYLNANITPEDTTARILILDKKESTGIEELAAEVFASFEQNTPADFIRRIRKEVSNPAFHGASFSLKRDNLVELIDSALSDETGSRVNPMYRFVKGITNGEYGKPKESVTSVATGVKETDTNPNNLRQGKCCGTCKNITNVHYDRIHATCSKFGNAQVETFQVCDDHDAE